MNKQQNISGFFHVCMYITSCELFFFFQFSRSSFPQCGQICCNKNKDTTFINLTLTLSKCSCLINKYITCMCAHIFLFCIELQHFAFQGREMEVSLESPTSTAVRQRPSEGKKGKRRQKETEHGRGRRVVARCLPAVNHSQNPRGLLQSDPHRVKMPNGNESVGRIKKSLCLSHEIYPSLYWNIIIKIYLIFF